MTEPSSGGPDTIVLIHGLWVTPLSWEHWVDRYTQRGFNVIAPAWPGLEGDIEELRRDPSGIANVGAADVVEHYQEIIKVLPTAPIIMGHSFGGAFTEVLLDHGLGAAGVAIDAAAVRGITRLPFSTLRSAWAGLHNPANRHEPVALNAKQFHYAFANTMSEEESLQAFERYAVPGPGRVLFDGALANVSRHSPFEVDFRNDDRAPLLLIAGGADHTVPASVDRQTFKRQSRSEAITEYKEFPGRSHFTIGQEGWEEVADYALDWAIEHARTNAPAT
jgi:alpha-beta hydrolase superfamily lysophospholipase